jgi:hypothetical protein
MYIGEIRWLARRLRLTCMYPGECGMYNDDV